MRKKIVIELTKYTTWLDSANFLQLITRKSFDSWQHHQINCQIFFCKNASQSRTLELFKY